MIGNYVKPGLICLCALGMSSNSVAQATHTPIKNIVLVHGAWADDSGWKKTSTSSKNRSHRFRTTSPLTVVPEVGRRHWPLDRRLPYCRSVRAFRDVGPNAKVWSYLAGAASSDSTLPRYNVNTFLNSATTRAFPLGSASA